MAARIRRQKRARQQFKTQAAGQKYYTPAPVSPAAPKTPAPQGSPKNPAVVRIKQPRIVTARQGYKAVKSTPGMVVFTSLLLLIVSQWSNFFGPYFWAILGGAVSARPPDLSKTTNPKLILGGLIFIAIMAFIAGISEAAGGVMLLSIFAMWLLWVMFAGRQTFSNFFKFFIPTQNTQTGSSAATPAQAPVVPVASPKT